MKMMFLAAAAAGLALPFAAAGTAVANPGDEWRKQFEIRAECDKKLREADSRREFNKEIRECEKKLAEWRYKVREESAKARYEAEKKWLERQKKLAEDYYD